jgi:replicative DNA helicase
MEVILTSTPTGRRGKFYQYCTDPPKGWKSFHKTCYDAFPPDQLTPDAIESLKKQYGHDGFEREFLANFGEEVEGVFDKDAIDEACKRGRDDFPYLDENFNPIKTNYPYFGYPKSLPKNESVFRLVGVDWDKYGAGTQILIIEALRTSQNRRDPNIYKQGMDANFDYIKVISRREIPKSKFTLSVAVNSLIEINREFSPDYYYLDAGYGEHQIEALQLAGINCHDPLDPAYGIHKKIVRINFSQMVELIDPATKVVVKKPIKPEMVGRLVNKFDTGEMVLSPFDDILRVQLENYVVEKITQMGVPKYTSKNEHAVDALMLAVWGLYEKFAPRNIESIRKAYIEKPIGQNFLETLEQVQVQQDKLGRRPDYFDAKDEVLLDNLDEDLKFARQGMIRPQSITTSKGVPDRSRASSSSSTTFQRGGFMPSGRRRF